MPRKTKIPFVYTFGEGEIVNNGINYRYDDYYSKLVLHLRLWRFGFRFRIRQKWMCEGENTNKRWYCSAYFVPLRYKGEWEKITNGLHYSFNYNAIKVGNKVITMEFLSDIDWLLIEAIKANIISEKWNGVQSATTDNK